MEFLELPGHDKQGGLCNLLAKSASGSYLALTWITATSNVLLLNIFMYIALYTLINRSLLEYFLEHRIYRQAFSGDAESSSCPRPRLA